MKSMSKTVKCLAALALAAALVSIFALTRGRGGVICQVEVEPVFYVAQGAVIDGRQVIVYDCALPQEDSYTTVTAEAYFEDGRLTVEANHDWAANETSATGNRVRLAVTLPEGTEPGTVEAVTLKVVDQRGSESVAELGRPIPGR